MDLNNINPYIRIATDSIIEPSWRLNERVIFDHELLYVKGGEVNFNIGNTTYEGKEGDVFFIKPKVKHSLSIISSDNFHQPHIHFDFFYKNDSNNVKVSYKNIDQLSYEELLLFREPVQFPDKLKIDNILYFEKLLFSIIKDYENKQPFYELNLKIKMIELIVFIMKNVQKNKTMNGCKNNKELIQIKEYLINNLDKQILLDEIANKFNISKRQILRIFKDEFGISPISYHNMLKIEKAKELMKYTDMSITSISDALGYSSVNAFSRSFKTLDGVSPNYYKRQDGVK